MARVGGGGRSRGRKSNSGNSSACSQSFFALVLTALAASVDRSVTLLRLRTQNKHCRRRKVLLHPATPTTLLFAQTQERSLRAGRMMAS